MKTFIGVLDTNNNQLLARVADLTMKTLMRESHLYPALQFHADDHQDAEAYFVLHYRHLFGLDLKPGEFTISERA